MLSLAGILSAFYLFLMIWLKKGLAKTDPHTQSDRTSPHQVSVVIAARNEAANLPDLIKSLRGQTFPNENWEVIIADDRSTDDTSRVLADLAQDWSQLKIVSVSHTPTDWSGKKWALQQALDAAQGAIILQTDADCRPPKNWVKTMVREFADPHLGMLCGPAPLEAGLSKWDILFGIESLAQDALSAGGLGNGWVLSCTGRNMAFRRQVFDEVKGYTDIAQYPSGDDDLLMQKVATKTNWDIRFLTDEQVSVPSPPPESWKQFYQQRLRFASKGLAYYRLSTTDQLRWIMPFIYIVNFSICLTLLRGSGLEENTIWWPLILKSLGDFLLVKEFFRKLNRTLRFDYFILLAVLHPFYVTIFGALGSFMPVRWKDS